MSTAEQPPPAQLLQMLFGYMVTRSISVVAELNVPDALKDGPQSTRPTWRRPSAPTRARSDVSCARSCRPACSPSPNLAPTP